MKRKERSLRAALIAFTAALLLFTIVWSFRDRPARALVLQPLETTENAAGYRLDINTATAGELEALPGIGPALARRMLDWQTENGPFTGKDDVLAVDGIGETTYERIEPYITFK